MARKRRALSSQFKAKAAMAAAKEDKTLSELAGEFGIHGGIENGCRRTGSSCWSGRGTKRRPNCPGVAETP